MKKWILICLVCVSYLVGQGQVSAEINTQEELVTNMKMESQILGMESPMWLEKSGLNKGQSHDRQNLSMILRPNATLRIRQTEPKFNGKLKLSLLTNDRKTEKFVDVGSEWVTVKADVSTTPFIETPIMNSTLTVEYEIIGDSTLLPVYDQNETEEEFFTEWDREDADFALIQGESFQLFVSKMDKEIVRKLKDFSSIDELIEHYEGIFAHYNKMTGLSADSSNKIDTLGENRYFLKADVSGPGGAYYSGNWAANTSLSTDMWLKKISWGALHEIAHGYQPSFYNKGMSTSEVWNNIYAADYEYQNYGKKADEIGWLFNYGKKDSVEKGLYQALVNENKGYDSINDLRYRLIMLTLLKQKAGNEAFVKMNQDYRRLANEDGFKASDYSLPNLMNKYYSEESGYDFTPILKKWKLNVDEEQSAINRYREYQATASLVDIVPESQLAKARALIDPTILINSNFELVDNQDITPLGLKGTINLKLDIDDINAIKDQPILLKEGSKIVKEVKITGKDIVIENIPNGVYTLDIPQGIPQSVGYEADQDYVFVKENKNDVTIKFTKLISSRLVNQTIQFLGLGDVHFADFSTNLNKGQATFNVSSATPHSYYAGEKYVLVQVLDTNDNVVYNKEIQGTKATVGEDTIPLEIGYKLVVFHDEPSRLKSREEILTNSKENTFIMTKYGLENVRLENLDVEKMFTIKLDNKIEEIYGSINLKENQVANKDLIWSAINLLSTDMMFEYAIEYYEWFF